jgi:hypothetical protein
VARKRNQERDARIAQRVLAGELLATVAAQYGLTAARCHQIVEAYCQARNHVVYEQFAQHPLRLKRLRQHRAAFGVTDA